MRNERNFVLEEAFMRRKRLDSARQKGSRRSLPQSVRKSLYGFGTRLAQGCLSLTAAPLADPQKNDASNRPFYLYFHLERRRKKEKSTPFLRYGAGCQCL